MFMFELNNQCPVFWGKHCFLIKAVRTKIVFDEGTKQNNLLTIYNPARKCSCRTVVGGGRKDNLPLQISKTNTPFFDI